MRALKKAEAERAQIRLKELEIQKLQAENDTLLARKEILEDRVRKAICYHEFLERATKMSGKVVALLVEKLSSCLAGLACLIFLKIETFHILRICRVI